MSLDDDSLDHHGNILFPKLNNVIITPTEQKQQTSPPSKSAIAGKDNKVNMLTNNSNNNNNHNTNGWNKSSSDTNGSREPTSPLPHNNNNSNQNNNNRNNLNGWSSPVREKNLVEQQPPTAAARTYPKLDKLGGAEVARDEEEEDRKHEENTVEEMQEEDKLIAGSRNRNGNGTVLITNGKTNGGLPGANGNKTGNGISEKDYEELDPLTGTKALKRVDESDRDEEDEDGDVSGPDDLEDEDSCGFGSCKPKWARRLATTHVFMVVFLLAWVFQGMYYTYFVSVITTIEKLFQIQSKVTGMLMSATEIGQISTALFLTYFAGRGHRPRWIACGMVVFAISSFGCTLPHFIFGDELLHASNVFHGGNSPHSNSLYQQQKQPHHQGDVSIASHYLDNFTTPINNQTSNLCLAHGFNSSYNRNDKDCQENILQEQAAHNQITNIVLVMFVLSLLGVGVGQTAVSTLGIPYIDDNVASRDSPIYIAITIGVRILGPAFGFFLGSVCTRIYVDVSVDPGIGPSDPKWVGAWWLGLLLVSGSMMMTSLAMFLFPKNLRGDRIPPPAKMREIEEKKKLEKQQDEENNRPQLKDFPKTIKRQLSNDILMCRTASSVLHLLPVAGLYTFLPKYMESQFRLTAHDANLISGIGGILVMGVGIVISGVVILKFNPTARSVAAWIAFTAFVYSCGMALLMFIGCPMDDMAGLKLNGTEQFLSHSPNASYSKNQFFELNCNLTCNCDFEKFSPICGADGLTYFSSCYAGCNQSVTENGVMKFSNCECISGAVEYLGEFTDKTQDAVSGFCEGKCNKFLPFILLFSFFVFMHSTGEVGSMLLIMRCTDPKDKAMAMGIIQFAIGLFGNVPCPIIYGAVVDSACLVWERFCDKEGACSLYNVDLFRHFFLGTTAGIMALAFVMDLVVWRKAHRIDIDPSSNNSETESEKPVVPESTV